MSTKNFLMASRKLNMHRFGMFPASNDLSWIDSATMGSPDEYVHPTTLTGTMNGSNAAFVMV